MSDAASSAVRPKVIHLTTTDMSLDWLLAPQLEAAYRTNRLPPLLPGVPEEPAP